MSYPGFPFTSTYRPKLFSRDRATYNASLSSAVSYSVDSPDDAPESLTFGDSFMEIAAAYEGAVTIGRSLMSPRNYSQVPLLISQTAMLR